MHKVVKLKNKLGTRQLPTAELLLGRKHGDEILAKSIINGLKSQLLYIRKCALISDSLRSNCTLQGTVIYLSIALSSRPPALWHIYRTLYILPMFCHYVTA